MAQRSCSEEELVEREGLPLHEAPGVSLVSKGVKEG